MSSGVISVRRAVVVVDGKAVAGEVKTKRSRRVLDIDPATMAVLRRWRVTQLEHRMLMGAGWRDTGLVFTDPTGEGWHPTTITQAFTRLVASSKLPRIRLHDARHSHASHLLAAGVNVKVVSERLGHASVAFTLDTYAHVMPGQQADAAAAVAALVDAL
jgi:integrase